MKAVSERKEVDYIGSLLPFTIEGGYIAGGALTSVYTNTPVNDLDIYFKSKEDFLTALYGAYDNNGWVVALSERAITFIWKDKTVVQLMFFDWFPTAQSIFDKFDFTCCMAALDLDSDVLHMHTRFLQDVSRRELVFNHNTSFPLASALRVKKYQERGFTISTPELLKVYSTIGMRGLKDWNDLANQIGGQYGEAATLTTEGDFNIDNVIHNIDTALQGYTSAEKAAFPGSYDDAFEKLYPEEFEKSIQNHGNSLF